jgi:peptidoglycan/xylan/chitin deacetylase (PgdA/CDA1 family)
MRVVCPTMHAEQLHLGEVWEATRATLNKSPLRWTIFVDPLMARIEGFDLRDQFSWFADRGHEIAMHTHHHLLQGEPGNTTGFLMGQPLDEGDIHRCLSENFEYLGERGYTPKGFLSGNWLVLGTTVEWLAATGFEYDSTLRTYSGPHPNSTLAANEPRRNVSHLGDLVEIPTTSSLKQQVQADLTLRRRSVDVADLSYELYYLHDYDLVDAKKRVAVRGLGTLERFAQSLTVHQLLERIGPAVDQ